jgi:hypothetical protein
VHSRLGGSTAGRWAKYYFIQGEYMLPETRYKKEIIHSWDEFYKWFVSLQLDENINKKRWIFRGERCIYPTLCTTIERASEKSEIPLQMLFTESYERRLINEFQRRAHHYLQHIPDRCDLSEWIALMQHFGAPTRLLDWSYSPFVAIYFAVERADGCKCIVWAMESALYTSTKSLNKLGENEVNEYFEKEIVPHMLQYPDESKFIQYKIIQYLFANPKNGIYLINPYRLSERASIQQGAHLMPGNIAVTFEANLLEYDQAYDNLTCLEIDITPKLRKEIIINLQRMNINRATLFPGIQGFAESMETRLSIPDLLSY